MTKIRLGFDVCADVSLSDLVSSKSTQALHGNVIQPCVRKVETKIKENLGVSSLTVLGVMTEKWSCCKYQP